jgi:hypothetical protein
MLEESFRVMTGDDETPPEKAVPAFMNKSKLDVARSLLFELSAT